MLSFRWRQFLPYSADGVANQPRTTYLGSFFVDFYDLLGFLYELNIALFLKKINTIILILANLILLCCIETIFFSIKSMASTKNLIYIDSLLR